MPRRYCSVVGLALVITIGGLGGSAWAAVAGTQHVTANSPSTSSNKGVGVTCPAGKRVLSPGMFIEFGNTNQVLLDDLRPSADLTSVFVNATEDETATRPTGRSPPPPSAPRRHPGWSGCRPPAR